MNCVDGTRHPAPGFGAPPCAFFARARARFIGVPWVFARLDRVRDACAYTCAVIPGACVVNTGGHSVRVVVAVAECLTAARNVCILSLVETKQPTEIAHMRIELNADQLLRICVALDNESARLLKVYEELPSLSPAQNDAWDKYLRNSSLSRLAFAAYRKADKKERLASSYPKVA